jgi:aminopeptidase C
MGTMQQEITDQLATEMSHDMDFEVLADVLTRVGWHQIELARFIDNHHAIDIREWVNINCKGQHRSRGRSWLFESRADAVLFKLRWS